MLLLLITCLISPMPINIVINIFHIIFGCFYSMPFTSFGSIVGQYLFLKERPMSNSGPICRYIVIVWLTVSPIKRLSPLNPEHHVD